MNETERELPAAEISDAEWEVMRIVWAKQGAPGRYMIDGLHEKLQWSESTTKTLIRRLVDKGYLTAHKENGVNFFEAAISEEHCNLMLADKLIGRICNTRTGDFLGKLIQRYELSRADITSLQAILSQKAAQSEISCNCTPCQCEHCGTHEEVHDHAEFNLAHQHMEVMSNDQ